jgi:outer membrane immunogenic protein
MRFLMTSAAVLALTVSAQAADLPRRTAPIAPPAALPIFTWTGFYLGVNAGYALNLGRTNLNGTPDLFATGFVPGDQFTGGDGFTGGVQAGYNFQAGNFVFGLEADINYVDIGRTRVTTIGPLTTTQSVGMEYLGTLRGRLGLAFDRFLVYATGGLAYGDFEASTTISGIGSVWTGSAGGDRWGYVVGAGAEYALTNNWSVRGEYLYVDLGRQNYASPLVSGPGAGATVFGTSRAEYRTSIFRAGLNYRF